MIREGPPRIVQARRRRNTARQRRGGNRDVGARRGCLHAGAGRVRSLESECKGLRGKALEAVKDTWQLQARLNHPSEITKQRLQFAQVCIPPADQREAGRQIGREIRAIVEANEANDWPQRPSIRFPDQKCVYCPMLGICAGDDALRDKKLIPPPEQEKLILVRPNTLTTKDWIEELEAA